METCDVSRVVLVIPSLNPDEKLKSVVQGALAAGFTKCILVDDGSDAEHKAVFETLGALPGCDVLHHPENKGKGEGLKTAFRHYLQQYADYDGVVTADGDGQHLTHDIVRCAAQMVQTKKMIYGCRDFSGPDVPKKSSKGNILTSRVFKLLCGIRLSDTQTGLRAIPGEYVSVFAKTKGSRFEYENEMIIDMDRYRVPYEELTIDTVYEDGNAGTHFRPVRDSVRIYKIILRYAVKGQFVRFLTSSVLCAVFEMALNWLLLTLLPKTAIPVLYHIFAAGAVSMILSSVLNQILNRYLVFRTGEKGGGSVLRYYCLWLPQTVLTLLLTKGLSWLFGATLPIVNTLLLFVARVIIFIFSYQIQKRWVFRKKDAAESR